MRDTVNIVQAHLGKELPSHLYQQLEQTRVFNPDVPVYLIISAGAEYDRRIIDRLGVIIVRKESIAKCANHRRFLFGNRLNRRFWGGFWLYTSERFFAIESFLTACRLDNVVHMENDVMLYTELSPLLPRFQERCPGIGITMDSERRCVPGFVFIRNLEALSAMNGFIIRHSLRKRQNDMSAIASFMKESAREASAALPVVPSRYRALYPLVSAAGEEGTSPWYDESFEAFGGIFDAASLGQFVGGVDKRLDARDTSGFINETAVYDPRNMGLSWKVENGKRRPYGKVDGAEFPIFTLHIHSKELFRFSSAGAPSEGA